jgi:hypothetical protein
MIKVVIPRVCEGLTDQANCPKAVKICGADSSEIGCTAKLLALHITSGETMCVGGVAKSLALAGVDLAKAGVRFGHWYGREWMAAMSEWWHSIPN